MDNCPLLEVQNINNAKLEAEIEKNIYLNIGFALFCLHYISECYNVSSFLRRITGYSFGINDIIFSLTAKNQ